MNLSLSINSTLAIDTRGGPRRNAGGGGGGGGFSQSMDAGKDCVVLAKASRDPHAECNHAAIDFPSRKNQTFPITPKSISGSFLRVF